jgi:hypothetical protein
VGINQRDGFRILGGSSRIKSQHVGYATSCRGPRDSSGDLPLR